MTLTTGRQIDPSFMGDFFTFSDLNPADIFVDDGRTPPPQPLTQDGTGAPPNVGGVISRPLDPNDGVTPHQPTIDPDDLPVENGDIGLWSGEGPDNPFWTTPHDLLPAKDAHGDLSDLPNGGPDGIGMKKEDFGRHGLQRWEDLPANKPTEEPGFLDKLIALIDYLRGIDYVDPDQSPDAVPNPHDMVGSLLGKGASSLPDGLGFDKELIDRMLGAYGEGDSSNAGKFADFLKALDAFEGASPGAAGALLNEFGLEEFSGLVREFLPHLDLDQANLEHFAKTADYTYQEQIDFSHLLAGSSVRDDLQI